MLHRRWRHLVAVLLGLTLLAAAAACGDDSDDSSTKTTDKSSQSSDLKVGLVYDIGGRGDQSYNDGAYAGLTKASEKLGVKTQDLEPSAGGEDREELLRTLADDGYGLIIGLGFNFADSMKKVAADYPSLSFAIVDDASFAAQNVTSLVFAEEQGSYLIGAAAALTSKTHKLGFIGGVEADLIKKFQAGYTAGAKRADPSTTVDVKYISQPPDNSGFNDPAKAKEIALGQFEAGADVVYHAAGGSGGGLFEAAKEHGSGVWAIGVDKDQALTADEAVRGVILTSMLKRVDVAVFNAIKEFKDGTLKAGTQTFDLSNDGIAIATTGNHLSADVLAKVDDYKQQIISGQIQVPTTP